jgi:hypothetical protein
VYRNQFGTATITLPYFFVTLIISSKASSKLRKCSITPSLNTTSNSYLAQARAGQQGFVAVAAGDILGNGRPDILTVDENNRITIVQDALSS